MAHNNQVLDGDALSSAQIQARMRHKDKLQTLQHIMAGAVGREWIWDLLASCGIFNSTLATHHEMSYLEGKRSIGLKVFNDIQGDAKCRKLFAQAQDEQLKPPE